MKAKALGVVIALSVILLVRAGYAQAPGVTIQTTTTSSTVAATTTTTTTLPAHVHPECAEWLALAITLGWPQEHLEMLEVVMWRESRCQPHQLNASDPNGGSIGLTQVNRFWCLPSSYYPAGYLQTYGVLSTCEELYLPEFNLLAALAIFDYSEGWSQWAL